VSTRSTVQVTATVVVTVALIFSFQPFMKMNRTMTVSETTYF
jgi:hypothetical protein